MLNKILMIIVAVVVLLPILIILGLIGLLGIGIAGFILGWWTIVGLILIVVSIFIAIIPPHVKIWIPLLIMGFLFIFLELLNII
jgi:hypothetical protein